MKLPDWISTVIESVGVAGVVTPVVPVVVVVPLSAGVVSEGVATVVSVMFLPVPQL